MRSKNIKKLILKNKNKNKNIIKIRAPVAPLPRILTYVFFKEKKLQ